ncbi:unnamed protein product, partial [Hymenolepis diminuta]
MRRRDVLAFLEAVITYRVPKDDLNLEILADLVKQVNERFPGSGKRAVFELNRKIKSILCKLPASGFDSGKEMDLRNLGRFLGLLTSAENQSGFDNRLDIISLLREAVAKGNNALRYIIPFVCQFLTGGGGITRKNFQIFKLLKLIHDKITVVSEIKSEIEFLFET